MVFFHSLRGGKKLKVKKKKRKRKRRKRRKSIFNLIVRAAC